MSTSRCPSCHACVRPAAPWCPLCHLDLSPSAQPIPAASVLSARSVDRSAPSGEEHARVAGWPCVPCGTVNDLDLASCGTCGSAFLAGLQTDAPAPLRLPLIGELGRLSRPATFGLAIGVGLLCALVLTGVLAVAGAVL